MREIEPAQWQADVISLWSRRWLLLTAGTMRDCNMMTVGWGSIGCMWAQPFAQVVVHPQRRTRGYMDSADSFTLCAFPEEYRSDLQTLGTISGKNTDKLAQTRLTLQPSRKIAAPAYTQASLIIECEKIYQQDMDPHGFLDATIQDHYPNANYHRIYFGRIVAILAE